MWLAYACGYMEAKGVDCRLLDIPAVSGDGSAALKAARQGNPSLIVVDTSTPSIAEDAAFAGRLKDAAGDACILLVGPHVAALPADVLNEYPAVDAVALGEYELTVEGLYGALAGGEGFSAVPGLAWRSGGTVVQNPVSYVEDPDALPFVSGVYFRHLDYTDYFYSHSRYPIVSLITARGCPFHCTYCVYPQTFSGHRVRRRSIGNVLDEVEDVLNRFPDLEEIMFEDDTLTMDPKWCRDFAREIFRRKLKFRWSANSRADLDYETLSLLKKAGARLFCVGVESADAAILAGMKKSLRPDRVRQFFKDACRAGILLHGCFLAGSAGETKETLEKTIRFAIRLRPDTAQFFPLMLYPGTEAFREARRRGELVETDYSRWLTAEGRHNTLLNTRELSASDLVRFCDRARRRFYLRPGYIAGRLWSVFRHPGELPRLLRGFRSLFRHLLRRGKG